VQTNLGIGLELAAPPDLPELRGDGRRIKQIFLNLLSNAVKFTPPNGRITFSARADESGLIITVADTGIGIAPDDLERILMPFEQAARTAKHPSQGTGLGLALSKSLTELHGGDLSIDSELGVGTTVTLAFPADRLAVNQPELPLLPPDGNSRTFAGPPPH